MISKWNWRVWKVSEIIYAQAFINGSRKSELPFLSKALSKVHEHALKYREYITAIRLNPNTSGEKMEQFYKKGTVADIISTLKKLVDRQEGEKVRAIYGWGPDHLSTQYAKLQMDVVKWHSLHAKKRRKHVLLFRQHILTMEQEFKKAQKSGKKANEKQRKRKETPEIFIERL